MKNFYRKYSILIFMILGTMFSTFSYVISNTTVIDRRILVIIWLIIGIFCSIIWQLIYEDKFYLSKLIGKTFLFTITIGGTLLFLFLSINRSFPTKSTHNTVKTEILRKSVKHKYGKNFPSAFVNIDGISKELIFSSGTNINEYKSVILELKKGYFEYYIINKQELEKY